MVFLIVKTCAFLYFRDRKSKIIENPYERDLIAIRGMESQVCNKERVKEYQYELNIIGPKGKVMNQLPKEDPGRGHDENVGTGKYESLDFGGGFGTLGESVCFAPRKVFLVKNCRFKSDAAQ